MKKLLAIILTLCILFTLAACSGNSQQADGKTSDTVSDTSSDSKADASSEDSSESESEEESSESKDDKSDKKSSKNESEEEEEESSEKEESSKSSSSKKPNSSSGKKPNSSSSKKPSSSENNSTASSSQVDPDLYKPLGSQVVSSSNKNDSSSSEADGLPTLNYSSVAKGYINHPTIWNGEIVKFDSFECMDQEYLFIPKGVTIMTEKDCAIFCYKVTDDGFVLEPGFSKEMGCTLTPSGYSVQHTSGTFQTKRDVLVRISVMGTLQDVQIFFPKEIDGKAELYTPEEAMEAFKK